MSEKYGSTLLEEQRVYKKAIEIQNNQQASVLGFSTNAKFRSNRDNTEYTRTGTYKCWFASDGRMLKTEDKFTTTRPNGEITNMLITTVYEFDPKIKIEVPVVKQ